MNVKQRWLMDRVEGYAQARMYLERVVEKYDNPADIEPFRLNVESRRREVEDAIKETVK